MILQNCHIFFSRPKLPNIPHAFIFQEEEDAAPFCSATGARLLMRGCVILKVLMISCIEKIVMLNEKPYF